MGGRKRDGGKKGRKDGRMDRGGGAGRSLLGGNVTRAGRLLEQVELLQNLCSNHCRKLKPLVNNLT